MRLRRVNELKRCVSSEQKWLLFRALSCARRSQHQRKLLQRIVFLLSGASSAFFFFYFVLFWWTHDFFLETEYGNLLRQTTVNATDINCGGQGYLCLCPLHRG